MAFTFAGCVAEDECTANADAAALAALGYVAATDPTATTVAGLGDLSCAAGFKEAADAVPGAACTLNADSTACAVEGGDCQFTPAVSASDAACAGTLDDAGNACALNADSTACAVETGDCQFSPAVSASAATCTGDDDGTGSDATTAAATCPTDSMAFTFAGCVAE